MIKLENIDVTFTQGKKVVKAVRNVSVDVEDGDIYGIIGYSGAGKSTLVRTINLLQRPTSGNVEVNGVDLLKLKPNELRDARKKIGMIFQHFNLMNTLSVFDNVAFPLKKAKKPLVEEGETAVDPTAEPKLVKLTKQEIKEKVDSLLQLVGLEDKANSYPSQLSGGQKQRVSLAAALLGRPSVLFLDEPSAGLDPQSRNVVFDIIREQREAGVAIILTTHLIDDAQKLADYVYIIDNGQTVREGTVPELVSGDGVVRLHFTLEAPSPTRDDLLPVHLRTDVELIEHMPYSLGGLGEYELRGPLTPEHLSAFTTALAHHYLMPNSLTMEPKTLEDVFLDISGRDIR